ncbi:speckle-type POZ protein-like [Ornithodoros turicata]|uniref:speckle-type POZ protein-like n=1 Tax=Ornithodoros turicata TaxID=34597 RepID=UPI003139E330
MEPGESDNLHSISYHQSKKFTCLHTWVIRDFSLIPKDSYVMSGKFSPEDDSTRSWRMRFWTGNHGYDCNLYLIFFGTGTVRAKGDFWVIGSNGLKTRHKVMEAQNVTAEMSWYCSLTSREELLNPSRGFLSRDVLTICCQLTTLEPDGSSVVENPPRGPSLMSDIGRLMENCEFADVVLTAEGKEFHAHKNILAMRSPVFRAMFGNNSMKETQVNRVDLEGISAEVLQEIVTFVYTDTAPNIDDLAADLLRAGEKYGLKRLKAMCEYNLATGIGIDTAVEVLRLAIRLNANELKEFAATYINAHTADVAKTNGWKAMVEEDPRLLELFIPRGWKTE